jgi:hypothetical protein
LRPLGRLAHKHGCAVLLIRHLNKRGTNYALHRGIGAMAFVGACPLAWLVGRDPQEAARCVLTQVKNNLAPPQPGLAFRVQAREGGPPQLDWAGTSSLTALQLLAGAGGSRSARPRDCARAFLEFFLAGGPHTSREIWEAAQEHGLSEHTLDRAKKELRIRSRRVWKEGKQLSYWLLPGQTLAGAEEAPDDPNSLEPWLEKLRQQYPPSTPLDDL